MPRVSHPTDEFVGAQPGEHSDGVGALPGTANETGVAVLPEEKKVDAAKAASSETNQGVRPGEAVGVGALADVPVGAVAASQAGPSSTLPQAKHTTTHADHVAGGESVLEIN